MRTGQVLAACGRAALIGLLLAHPVRAQEESRQGPPTLVLHCGTLLLVPGRPPLDKATLVVREGRVVQVESGFVAPEQLDSVGEGPSRLIDLSGQFVLPGLIDAHTHILWEYAADARLRSQEGEAAAALRGAEHARRTLLAGFTTIRDLGSSGGAVFALREAIRVGRIPGPRIMAAGQAITPTGGHADETFGYRYDPFGAPGQGEGVADGPDACRRAVRVQVGRGADLIKLTATGGVLSATAAGTDQQFFADELEAIVATARMLGRKVAAHAHGARGIHAALRAGVDSIEHGTFLDDEAIELFQQTGAFLVPTALAGKTVEARARIPGFFPPSVVQKALRVGSAIQGALERAHARGVRIAFGTDAGVSPHGENAREFALLVEAGLTPSEAIVAATVNAAELLGLASEIGTLEPGRAADLIATAGNPLVDVSQLRRPTFVMRGGEIYLGP